MPQVFEIVPHAFAHLVQSLGLAAQTVDLGQPRNAGSHLVADHVAADELRYISLCAMA